MVVNSDADELFDNSLTLKKQGKVEEAITALRQALLISPEDIQFLVVLGNTLSDAGRYLEAIVQFKQAIDLMRTEQHALWVEAVFNIGVAYKEAGLFTDAIQWFKAALKVHPELPDLHYSLGNSLRRLGLYEDALLEYQAANTLDAHYIDAINNEGLTLFNLQRYLEAIVVYRRGISLDPDDPDLHRNLGSSLVEIGHLEDAVVEYNQALHLNENYLDIYPLLASVLTDLGQWNEVVELYRESRRKSVEVDDLNIMYEVALEQLRQRN